MKLPRYIAMKVLVSEAYAKRKPGGTPFESDEEAATHHISMMRPSATEVTAALVKEYSRRVQDPVAVSFTAMEGAVAEVFGL